MQTPVLTQIEKRIGFVTLNRPDKRNALNPEMIEELAKTFSEFERNGEVKVVVVRAEGKAFCAGADLAYLERLQQNSLEENLEDSHRLKALFSQIYEFPKPVIAQVQGHALAGGCGLVTVCDFAFAVPEAKFGYTEAKIGFVPALVSVFLAEQLSQARATELLLSAEVISAAKALGLGLVTEVVAYEALQESVREFAMRLVEGNSSFSMQETKRLLRSLGKKAREEALNLAADANAKTRSHADCVKGVAAFLSKTKPDW
ncbi:enoyl-CoA hydratase/isomerase family protein [Algoriphagus aestuariicola]|jgi:methylglutaconyl-CoA hydratase|uniref:Enoyl-CoA hydratase/isomerase family protein n=1 Tax=Algoriphagus aestuariicola TaxID=1852016 RepID=A0ABS3BWP4_9BACT|nr:enoyl-CoA hydratase-related protein [Algoriphagus aestuariicola]MBN7803497.1 enoyl-CoA hydratase/isomerase family protein [Algoriphagus aestuariicola]